MGDNIDNIDRNLDMDSGLLTMTNVLTMNMMPLIFIQYNFIFIQNITHTNKLTSWTDL
jgi:hypothetical protein